MIESQLMARMSKETDEKIVPVWAPLPAQSALPVTEEQHKPSLTVKFRDLLRIGR